ncbi:unnamed protein product [Ambrosiozyma monospora]|uniref:Unnamed protein product n=1 Tax=Ambrosiozyma monospora TaxID=43982 RepID=A0A9W6WL74_AMBMO|nr:unnamed protein product [Ambrosiozyma monospora]
MPSTIVGYIITLPPNKQQITTKQTANYQQTSKLPANQQTSQPTNQSTNKPANQSTSQPVNPPTNQPTNDKLSASYIGMLDNYNQFNCMHACVFCIFTYNLQV